MNFRARILVALVLCLAALGCATSQTSELEKPLGDPYLFVFSDENKVFSIAYHALGREVEPGLIKELNGPVKGFYARKETWGGNTNYWVRVFAANGASLQARNTYGYYAEVMVEGDKGKESESAKRIFSDMESMFAQQGQKVYVRNLARAKYRSEEIGDYKSGAYNFESAPRPDPVAAAPVKSPSAEPVVPAQPIQKDAPLAEPARGEYVAPPRQAASPAQRAPSGGSVGGIGMADELLKLDELRKKGILSEEEFQQAKQRVLNW